MLDHNARMLRFIRFLYISAEIHMRFGFSILGNFLPDESTVDFSLVELFSYSIELQEFQLFEINTN